MAGLAATVNQWAAKRVFVTGATGVLGGWICHALVDAGADVVALIKDADHRSELFRSGLIHRIATVHGTVEDFRTLERAVNDHETDTVIHLAAQTLVGAAYRSPLHTFETNIAGTYNLLEACRLHAGLVQRVVVASSDKAYGDNQGQPYSEDTPLRARHPYDVSKACVDLLARSYASMYGLPIVVIRCSNIYGGGDLNWSRIVPGVIRALLQRESPVLRGDGTNARDYVYAQDAAAGYLLAALQANADDVRGEAFNLSSGTTITTLDLVGLIAGLMGVEGVAPIVERSAVHEIANQAVCSDRARKRFGWAPQVNLPDGLTRTIAWYEHYFQSPAAATAD